MDSKEKILNLLEQEPLFTNQYLRISPEITNEMLADELYTMIQNPDMKDLYNEIQKRYGDFSDITKQLTDAFKSVKDYYPDVVIPKIVAFITGMGTDLYVSKELIVIGLDFFMGSDAKYKLQNMPNYILRTYEPEYLVPRTILVYLPLFIDSNIKNSSLLDDIIYLGKLYYFARQVLPEVDDSILLGYTDEQIRGLNEHKADVWTHFIDNKLFYITDHFIKKKYITSRPFTSEISIKCPGCIGKWLGWQIVNSYMKHHKSVKLSELMHNTDANTILLESKYKP